MYVMIIFIESLEYLAVILSGNNDCEVSQSKELLLSGNPNLITQLIILDPDNPTKITQHSLS